MENLNFAWSTPLFRKELYCNDLNNEIKTAILENEIEERKHPSPPQDSHQNLFESTFDFLSWSDPRITAFKNYFINEVGKVVKYTNQFSTGQMAQLRFAYHCWFHITRSGGFFPPHNHAMASWSAIYCVDAGDEDIDHDHTSGRVTFYDPRSSANMYLDPANKNLRRDMSFNSVRFRLKPTELVVFPSYLQHSVEPYEGKKPRITIAANFWFGR